VAQIIEGEHIGTLGTGELSAVMFDPTSTQVLSTRRTDNGLRCLPGGRTCG
jgi:hypothetical protein